MMRENPSGCKNIAPNSSIRHNEPMGRPKNLSREGVLEKALPVFWKHGFTDTSLQELEKATGVNKSGLYDEFADKRDLYLESLRYYLRKRQEEGMLTAEPLGWKNIERFLKLAPCSLEGQKGCFSVNSMNQFAVLPRAAQKIVSKSHAFLKDLIARHVGAENPAVKLRLCAVCQMGGGPLPTEGNP